MSETPSASGASYAAAGVDIDAGDRAVELMKEWVKKTQRPEVLGGLGGFAGLFDASALKRFERPLLASATDGVGTKVDIARQLGVYDTIGHDLVAMVMDDIVVCGAEPLFMTDYICVGKVHPERVAAIVKGIAEGCVLAGCALVGGETAEHPGLLDPDEYDLAGAGTGIVDADDVLGAERVKAGDAVIAMGSSGLHCNGYSLARHVLFALAGWTLERHVDELGRTIGEELLEPTRIYSLDCLALAAARHEQLHAMAHITGGGIAENLARVIPADVSVIVDRSTWTPPTIFSLIADVGSVPREEIEQTLNQGVGMVALVDAEAADDAVQLLEKRGVTAWRCGEVTAADGEAPRARLVGDHPATSN
jgi:phosphoribosylformylglycinamidine cyclo-ligase